MKLARFFLAAALTMAVAAVAVAHSEEASVDTSLDDEGLASVEVQGLNHVYARPGVDLRRYTNVMLDPIEVSFSESLNRLHADPLVTVAGKRIIKQRLARSIDSTAAARNAAAIWARIIWAQLDDAHGVGGDI